MSKLKHTHNQDFLEWLEKEALPETRGIYADGEMSKKNEISPAIQMYRMAMSFKGFQQCRSRLRNSHAKNEIVKYCIKFGIQFFIDDFKVLPSGEEYYALSCGEKREFENRSAALAMESFWNRKPFLLREIDNKTPERIYVGRCFEWSDDGVRKLRLKCTSFNDEKKYFNACEYDDSIGNPIRRFKITHEDIKKFHKMLDKINKRNEK